MAAGDGDFDDGDSPFVPYPAAPVPPHERTWRHPSELSPISVADPVAHHSPSRLLLVATGVCGVAFALVVGRVMVGGANVDVAVSTSIARLAARSASPSDEFEPRSGASVRSIPPEPAVAVTIEAGAAPAATDAPAAETTGATASVGYTVDPEPAETAVRTAEASTTSSMVSLSSTSLVATRSRPTVATLVASTAPPLAHAQPDSVDRWGVVVEDQYHAVTTSAGVRVGDTLWLRLDTGGVFGGTVSLTDRSSGLAVVRIGAEPGTSDTDDDSVTSVVPRVHPVPAAGTEVGVMRGDGATLKVTVGAGRALALEPGAAGEAAPVVDADGYVVGLCTWKGSSATIVPAHRASKIVRASIGWIGVGVDSDPAARGVRVENVEAGSPADKAGLRPMDVVTQLDGITITSVAQLVQLSRSMTPGSTASITYLRQPEASADTSVPISASVQPAAAVTIKLVIGSLADAP